MSKTDYLGYFGLDINDFNIKQIDDGLKKGVPPRDEYYDCEKCGKYVKIIYFNSKRRGKHIWVCKYCLYEYFKNKYRREMKKKSKEKSNKRQKKLNDFI